MTTTPTAHRTLLLTDDADTAALTALARDGGWRLDHLQPFSHAWVTQRVWLVPPHADASAAPPDGHHAEVLVREVEHHLHGTRFVTVSGDDADLVARLARAVAETVPTTPLDAVLDGLLADDATPRALCRGLHLWQSAYFLPLVFRVPPERPIGERERAAVARLLRHPERQVRLSTMLAVDTLQHVDAELRRLVLARRAEETELDFVVTAFERVEEQAGASVT